ncbi:HTH domain-containing protein [Chitinophaga sp. Cy-1792]|uniref:HTH domain-containing protein n=1 Tax=Chitinophaga sp. Cy-1792 TaxID=2608339 RepID=UPI00141DE1B2|nr:HTH domain-containing protein [Chitinophaga sp. Cy-1792]
MLPLIIERLSAIDYLITHKKTGTPLELSKKLRVSERSARQYITCLRQLGAPIAFSRTYKSYYYKEEGYFNFQFTLTALSEDGSLKQLN